MKYGRIRKRDRPNKKILALCGLIVSGALAIGIAYMTGDYAEYHAAEEEQKELVRELRIARAAEDMPLIDEADYATAIPEKAPGDAREEIIQAKPPNMVESQSDEIPENLLQSAASGLEDETQSVMQVSIPEQEPETQETEVSSFLSAEEPEGSVPASPAGKTDPVTGGQEQASAPPHQVGQYTGVDFTAARAKNSDFIAWLTIPGTKVDYPVVLTDNTVYYLTHGFTGKTSKLGTLFSLGKTDYKTPGKNIAIYGHHITDTSSGQKMFRPLLSYKQKSFWEKHQTVYLDSLYYCGKYRIFAVINMVNNTWDPSAASFASDDDFLAFIRQAQSQALYDTGMEIEETDHILTLITCDRSFASKEGRLVVMAVEE